MSANSNSKKRRQAIRKDRRRLMAGMETLEPRLLMAGIVATDPNGNRFQTDAIMVKFTDNATPSDVRNVVNYVGGTVEKGYSFGKTKNLYEVAVPAAKQTADDVNQMINTLKTSRFVSYAERNYVREASLVPNDPYFSNQWGHVNTGQAGGTSDADIDADEAWETSTGSKSVIVAVIDTGFDFFHPDLQANLWTNPNEIPGDGIDNDNNGYVDDIHGWDTVNDDANPQDDQGHGTHVSGILGAQGNNGVGVSGVNWNVSILPVKFLDQFGSGSLADEVEAIDYVTKMKLAGNNIVVSNNSYGSFGFAQSEFDAISANNNAGVLFAAAAGNFGVNNDFFPNYPSNTDLPNVIAVAATNRNDQLSNFSQYGATTVDLGAPGEEILSTVPTFYNPTGYEYFDGTSMATPEVAGAIALLSSIDPSLSPAQLKQAIFDGVDVIPALGGKTVTGGRLNLGKSVEKISKNRVQGHVYADERGDGQLNAGDDPIANVTVYRDANNNGVLDTGEKTAVTDANGFYDLGYVPKHTILRVAPPANYSVTIPGSTYYDITFSFNGEVRTDVNFGLFGTPSKITGYKYFDPNSNGRYEPQLGEYPVQGAMIYVDYNDDGRISIGEPAAITDKNGFYQINQVFVGTHAVREVTPPGSGISFPTLGYYNVFVPPATVLSSYDFYNSPAFDYGDLPASYGTLAKDNGPSHGYWYGYYLGASVDADPNGRPSIYAGGDDNAGVDDDDGIKLLQFPSPGNTFKLQATVHVPTNVNAGYLNGWFDWNRNGTFEDSERAIQGAQRGTGVFSFNIDVPKGIGPGEVYARFRYSSTKDLGPLGPAREGEVEDYRFPVYLAVPAPIDDNYTLDQFSTFNKLDVLANDIRSANGELRIVQAGFSGANLSKTTANGGTVRLNRNGTPNDFSDDFLSYDAPPPSSPGVVDPLTDYFTYRVTDGVNISNPVNVNIKLNPVDTAPIAGDDYVNLPAGVSVLKIDVLANDRVGTDNGTPYSQIQIRSVQAILPSLGSVSINRNGTPNDFSDDTIVFRPAAALDRTKNPTIQFQYTIGNPGVTDPALLATGTVTVHVGPNGTDSNDIARLSFRVFANNPDNTIGARIDNAGPNQIYSLTQGSDYWVGVYALDLRAPFQLPQTGDPGNGVLSPFLDISYLDQYVTAVHSNTSSTGVQTRFTPPYAGNVANQSGQLLSPGFIDEIGAATVQGNFFDTNATRDNPVFFVRFHADNLTPGAGGFSLWQSDPADNPGNKIFVTRNAGTNNPADYDLQELTVAQVAYLSSARFRVVAPPAPVLATAPLTTTSSSKTTASAAPVTAGTTSSTTTAKLQAAPAPLAPLVKTTATSASGTSTSSGASSLDEAIVALFGEKK